MSSHIAASLVTASSSVSWLTQSCVIGTDRARLLSNVIQRTCPFGFLIQLYMWDCCTRSFPPWYSAAVDHVRAVEFISTASGMLIFLWLPLRPSFHRVGQRSEFFCLPWCASYMAWIKRDTGGRNSLQHPATPGEQGRSNRVCCSWGDDCEGQHLSEPSSTRSTWNPPNTVVYS